MLNIQKQIDYWIKGADEDIVTADLLIRERRTLHGLFFCHLVIEKDIDLMIVTENENDDNLAGRIWKLTKKVNSKIEPFLVGTKRFNSNDNSPLVDLVKRTGIEIV